MISTAHDPSQADRLEAVADATNAGPGATDKNVAGDPFSGNTAGKTSLDSSEATAEQKQIQEPQSPPDAPQRSTFQIFLVMGSLCVSCEELVS